MSFSSKFRIVYYDTLSRDFLKWANNVYIFTCMKDYNVFRWISLENHEDNKIVVHNIWSNSSAVASYTCLLISFWVFLSLAFNFFKNLFTWYKEDNSLIKKNSLTYIYLNHSSLFPIFINWFTISLSKCNHCQLWLVSPIQFRHQQLMPVCNSKFEIYLKNLN